MYLAKRDGGDRVSTANDLGLDERGAMQRQQVSGYIEGFLQREHTDPEHLDELICTLRKLCGGEGGPEDYNGLVAREAIEALSRAAELRELHCAGHGELVSRYAELIARALGRSHEEVDDLIYTARVHDVGRFSFPTGSSTSPARSPMMSIIW